MIIFLPMSVLSSANQKQKKGHSTKTYRLPIKRVFTKEGVHPFAEIEWRWVKIKVHSMSGKEEERELEFPAGWSENAMNIVGSKYFRGRIGSEEREYSVKQIVSRVAGTIKEWGIKSGYFDTEEEADIFEAELSHILVNQYAAFNSPVWFNVGIEKHPQCSACFILSVEDDMESILEWIKTEGLIFKGGSGAGIDLSPLRSSKETLSKGGYSSGPVAFMRGADAVAGMIASGGSTRRAAKMVVLRIDHPDILKFIWCKAEEERKVKALIDAGYNMYDLNNPAWSSIQYQNANNSVRVTDEFMEAVERDEYFETRFVTTGEVADRFRARDLFRQIAEAAWSCGDPGVQYDTTINRWNTAANTGRINASNPCSEYMHLDNSACNLASINLLKYLNQDGTFKVKEFIHTVDIMILAQEIIVDHSKYPTEKIAKNVKAFRELGLGFANLGALIMSLGIPYDSEEARHTASAITSLMCGEAYRYSAQIARRIGPFAGFAENREPMLKVLEMHREAAGHIRKTRVFDQALYEKAVKVWDEALSLGRKYGVRNSQTTVIAPTGTIAFMMDCTTTGIEPAFALVAVKKLVGGGTMRLVNTAVPNALKRLGYKEEEMQEILEHIEEKNTIEGAPYVKQRHIPVFDCAVKPSGGSRAIHWTGHVKMVAAVQPFISGAISKTFNMPNDATVEDIMDAFMMGWKLGLKAFAVYRDGSKAAQPLVTRQIKEDQKMPTVVRRRLPPTRASETHKFSIAGHKGFLTYSMFEDGSLAEIFITMSKQGSTLAGLMDAFAIAISIALQHGVPFKALAKKFVYSRFEPAGFTENPDIQIATSITDYIFRYLALRFLPKEELEEIGIEPPAGHIESAKVREVSASTPQEEDLVVKADAKDSNESMPGHSIKSNGDLIYADSVCRQCGGMMIQTGSCKTCIQCGTSNGGC